MGEEGLPEISLPAARLWWQRFNRASQRRWVSALVLTALACGPLWLGGRAWLVLVAGVETTGHVTRDRGAVWYEVAGRRYTTHEGLADLPGPLIWGDPVRVRYLPVAPEVAWSPEAEDGGVRAALLVAFIAFVAAPLVWLWGTQVVGPALAALREVRAALGKGEVLHCQDR
jgi:hypothetical protein